MTVLVDDQVGCDKLQSHKSSFQAWKCVSFGCSLLAIVLLLSKWYEVNSDLQLLVGIERILTLQNNAESANKPLSWPPVPLDQLLPAANETDFGMASMESNGSMLMSHMHITLSREFTGNQLIEQEVSAFLVEFKNAKATLSLSSLLVSVYIVSWILMSMAINDTRISNDISLRNILLLSVFGAIDIAASVGFVMVRLIMYSVKNNSFAAQMLSSSGLSDTPVRLSADQLTAFTALRLIAMRSCSAYIDIYVSVLVALVTLLRLYAILRALSFYRLLRRVNDRQSLLSLADAQSHFRQPQFQFPPESKQLVWTSQSPIHRDGQLRPTSVPGPAQYRHRPARYLNRPASSDHHRRRARSPELDAQPNPDPSEGADRARRHRQRVEASATPPPPPPPPSPPSPPVEPSFGPPMGQADMKAKSDVDEPKAHARKHTGELHQVFATLRTEPKRARQQVDASSYTLIGSKSATLGKYRLVARYKPVSAGSNKTATVRSESRTRHGFKSRQREPLSLIEELRPHRHSRVNLSAGSGPLSSSSSYSIASSGSTCDESDDSTARVTSQHRESKDRQPNYPEGSPVSTLYQTEEFMADKLRGQRVFELAPASCQNGLSNTLLMGKYYYA